MGGHPGHRKGQPQGSSGGGPSPLLDEDPDVVSGGGGGTGDVVVGLGGGCVVVEVVEGSAGPVDDSALAPEDPEPSPVGTAGPHPETKSASAAAS